MLVIRNWNKVHKFKTELFFACDSYYVQLWGKKKWPYFGVGQIGCSPNALAVWPRTAHMVEHVWQESILQTNYSTTG